MNDQTDYKKIFSEIIKKQMVILGPDITFAKVKKVNGMTVDPDGTVLNIEGDPKFMLASLVNEFVDLSGLIIKKTIESVLLNYPGLATISMLDLGLKERLPASEETEAKNEDIK